MQTLSTKAYFPHRCFGNHIYFVDSITYKQRPLLWGLKSYKIETLQKKALRLRSNSEYISHTNPQFIEMKI